MPHVAQEGVEHAFAGQDVGAGVAERGETRGGVVGSAAADGVAEKGHLQAGVEGVERSLVNADRSFQSAQQEVFSGCDGFANGVIGER